MSRPRFLGISEFGPQSIIYHEGGTFRVRRAILRIRDEQSASATAKLPVTGARLCPACGYAHFGAEQDFDRCVVCDEKLGDGQWLKDLYRIDQVSTRRALRITSDEEERQRLGYEMITTLRYAQSNGRPAYSLVSYSAGGKKLLEMRYGSSATLWRINLGWRRRKDKNIFGFKIDVISGEWAKDDQSPEAATAEEEMPEGKQTQRIIPYVEDRKNCLVVHPAVPMDDAASVTFQYALKRGIEATFQLENSELAVEALTTVGEGNTILLYEAAEGGAGVLTRLASDPNAMKRVAEKALQLCHYRSKSGTWEGMDDLENSEPDCEAGCYRCLLSYSNQIDHQRIDRKNADVLDLLSKLTKSDSAQGQAGKSPSDLLRELNNLSTSSLEREWLRYVESSGLHLPNAAQLLLADFDTRADFAYTTVPALIFVDGPQHDRNTQRAHDQAVTRRLLDAGYTVIRFPSETHRWGKIFDEYRFVFRGGEASEIE